MARAGRPALGPRPMSSTERSRACRARARVRKLAERPELAEAAELTRINSGMLAPPTQPAALPEPPPLPADPVQRAEARLAELEGVLRVALRDPTASATARVSAARTLAELYGLLRHRAPPPDPEAERERQQTDPAWLAEQAAKTRAEVMALRELLAFRSMLS